MPLRNAFRFVAPRFAALLLCAALTASAAACTIPVFRYALERWEADRLLVVVYHDRPLASEQDAALNELGRQSTLVGGPLNIQIVRYDVTSQAEKKPLDLAPPGSDRPLPYVEIRSRGKSSQTVVRWHGPLEKFTGDARLFDSPARRELVERLTGGHSAVWLLVAPAEQTRQLAEQLQTRIDGVTPELVLPQGIGLPGSELYSSIPLEIRFSVLPIAHDDPTEQPLLQLLASAAPSWKPDTAYVIPVFGRCRALEVFSLVEADELLLRDVGEFLCAACSCRVKEANPGFDLLTSIDWNARLFGGAPPPFADAPQQRPAAPPTATEEPQFVTIPTGDPAPAPSNQRVHALPSAPGFTTFALSCVALLLVFGTAGALSKSRFTR